MKRRRTPRMVVSSGSPKQVVRLAAFLALNDLGWQERNIYEDKAKRLLDMLAKGAT